MPAEQQDELDAALAETGKQKHGRWSRSDLLLAALVDEVRFYRHDFATANSEKGKGPKKDPDPIPRPGVESKRARKLNDEQRTYLERLRQNRGKA